MSLDRSPLFDGHPRMRGEPKGLRHVAIVPGENIAYCMASYLSETIRRGHSEKRPRARLILELAVVVIPIGFVRAWRLQILRGSDADSRPG